MQEGDPQRLARLLRDTDAYELSGQDDEGIVRLLPRQRSAEELRVPQLAEMEFDVHKAADATEEDHVLEFIGSTSARDSYGDRIEVKGWELKRFKANPVFMPAHQYGVIPLGKALKVWKEEDALRFRIKFATDLPDEPGQIALNWYNAYKAKYVKGTSVGFLPMEWRIPKDDAEREKFDLGRYGVMFTKQELLELSAAPVPSNPEALLQNSALVSPNQRTAIRAVVIEVLQELTKNDEEPTPAPDSGGEAKSGASSSASDGPASAAATPEPTILEKLHKVLMESSNGSGA